MDTRLGKPKIKPIKILVDSGTTSSIIMGSLVKKLRTKDSTPVSWKTKAGIFKTNKTCKLKFRLPELYEDRIVEYKIHVDDSRTEDNCQYDMLLGGDICTE